MRYAIVFRTAAWRIGLLLGAVVPGGALALTNPVLIDQPTSATSPAWGSQRKLLRLGNPAGSMAAVSVTSANQLRLGISSDGGSTWTGTTIRNGPYGSVTAFTFSAVADPATGNLHVVFSSGPVGSLSTIGYAVGTWAATPADPTFTWSITANALGNNGNDHLEFPSAALATAGGFTYLHVVFGQKENNGQTENRVLWNVRRLAAGVGGWLNGPGGRNVTLNEYTGNNTARLETPGPIPSVVTDEGNRLWVAWWDTNAHVYIRRFPLSGTVWSPDAQPFATFAAGPNSTKKYPNIVPTGSVHSAALRQGGGQLAWVLPGVVAQDPTVYTLHLNNTTATAWSGPGSAPVAVTGLDVAVAGDGWASIVSGATGDWFAFMKDSATRSRGTIVFYRYPPGGPLSDQVTFWDDPGDPGNRHPSAGLDTAGDVAAIWSASQTGGAGIALRYFGIAPAAVSAGVAASASMVCQGTVLTVTLTVTNAGNLLLASATPFLDLRAVAGDSATFAVLSAPTVTSIPGGGCATFIWTLSGTGFTAGTTGQGTVSMTASVTGVYAGAMARAGAAPLPITLYAPARLTSAAAVSATTLSTGQVVSVVLTVSVTGGVGVDGLAPVIAAGPGSGGAVTLAGPTGPVPAVVNLASGGTATFTWTYTVSGIAAPGEGTITFSVTATGMEALCGAAVSTTLSTPAVLVQRAASLDGSVVIVGPDPTCVGSQLIVTQTVTNTGVAAARLVAPGATPYVTGPGAAAFAWAPAGVGWLAAGSSVTFAWVMNAIGAGNVQFTVTTSALDANSGQTVTTGPATSDPVTVNSPGGASSLAVPGLVSLGEWFTVALSVTNNGGTAVNGVSPTIIVVEGGGSVRLIGAPTPAGPVTIPAGATVTFRWTYSASGIGVVAFFGAATGISCGTGGVSIIVAPAELAGALAVEPDAVNVGQAFRVVLTVTNTGEAPALGLVPAPVLKAGTATVLGLTGPVPASWPTLPGGATAAFTWTYSATGAGTMLFSVTAGGQDAYSGTFVGLSPPADAGVTIAYLGILDAVAVVTPASACEGQSLLVVVTVTNTGSGVADAVAPATLRVTGTGSAVVTSGPSPAGAIPLAGGAVATFTWTCTAGSPGNVSFSTTVYGTDANSGLPESSGLVESGPATTDPIAVLTARLSAPAGVSIGQWYTTSLTVTNTGGVTANGVTAELAANPGGGAATLVSGPLPAGPVTLMAGGATTFEWTWSAAGAATVGWTATVTGFDACGVHAGSAAAGTVSVPPAALAVLVRFDGKTVNIAQPFDVVVTVSNTGGAEAAGVDLTPPLATGTGIPLLQGGPFPPLPATIPGGGSASFTWSYIVAGEGWVAFTATATGHDAQTGEPCAASVGESQPLTVQTPAALAGALMLAPGATCLGRTLLLTMTVTNAGQATALGVDARPLVRAGAGDAIVIAGPAGLPMDLAGGASASFSWTLTGVAEGTLWFTVTVGGTDANDGSVPDTGPLPSGPADITPGSRLVTSVVLPARVSVGQWFTLAVTVTNSGTADAVGVVPSIAVAPAGLFVTQEGPVVPAGPLTIAAGGSTTFVWTYSAAGAAAVGFGMIVTGNDACGAAAVALAAAVMVQRPALLATTVSVGPNPANIGQVITVVASVTNTGEAAATGVAPGPMLATGPAGPTPVAGPVPAGPVTLAAGASIAFTWGFGTAAAGPAVFSTTVFGLDENTAQPVPAGGAAPAGLLVQTPAALSAVMATPTATACPGRPVLVTVTVSNTGEAAAAGITASALVTAGSAAAAVSGPSPAQPWSLPGGAWVTFTWTLTGSAPGDLVLTTSITGFDANDGGGLATGPVSAGPLMMVGGAVLSATASASAITAVGEWLTVRFTVSNTGDDPVANLVPSLAAAAGAGLIVPVASPAGLPTLAAGATTTFVWTFSASGAGTVAFSLTAAGSDACGPVEVAGGASGTIFSIARLEAAGVIAPSTAGLGQVFEVRLTVSETGGGLAGDLAPAIDNRSLASLILLAGPVPAAIAGLGPHGSGTFTWTWSAAGAGPVFFGFTATGMDAWSGAPLTAVAGASGTVLTPPFLALAVAAGPVRTGIAQVITVTATAANSGQTDAVAVIARFLAAEGDGQAVWLTGPTPAVATVAAQGSVAFTWTYRAVRGGPVRFRVEAGPGPGSMSPVAVSNEVIIEEAGTTLAALLPYPNPFVGSAGGSVRFRFMPPLTRVTLYTVAGHRVRGMIADVNGSAEWDGRNEDGAAVMTGVYLYVARSPAGARKTGEIHVRR